MDDSTEGWKVSMFLGPGETVSGRRGREARVFKQSIKNNVNNRRVSSTPFDLYPGIPKSKSEQISHVHLFLPPNTFTSLQSMGPKHTPSLTPTAKGPDAP